MEFENRDFASKLAEIEPPCSNFRSFSKETSNDRTNTDNEVADRDGLAHFVYLKTKIKILTKEMNFETKKTCKNKQNQNKVTKIRFFAVFENVIFDIFGQIKNLIIF